MTPGHSTVLIGLGLALLTAVPARAGTYTWNRPSAVTDNWFTATNWLPAGGPTNAGDSALVTNGCVLLTNATAGLAEFLITNAVLVFSNWEACLSAAVVTVCSSGTLTHVTNSATTTNISGEWIPDARVNIVCSNFTLAAGGQIDANYRGYRSSVYDGYGPGRGKWGYNGAGGAAYGGRGEWGGPGAGGTSYPSYLMPTNPGSSGGGFNGNTLGGAGGGAVRIEAAGTVTLDGTVSANGGNGGAQYTAGGSGGGIFIQCFTFAGSTNGRLRANGGVGAQTTANWGGAGGGGRIAVLFTNTLGTVGVRFSAAGGAPSYYTNLVDVLGPAMGSLYLSNTNALGEFFARADAWQNQVQGAYLFFAEDSGGFKTNCSVSALTLSNVFLGLPDGYHLAVTNNLVLAATTATNSGLFLGANSVLTCSNLDLQSGAKCLTLSNASLTCSGGLVKSNAELVLWNDSRIACGGDVLLSGERLVLLTNPVFNCAGSLTLTNGASLTVYSGPTNETTESYGALVGVTNHLAVAANCWIYPYSHQTNGGSALFRVGSLALQTGGGINADAGGYGGTYVNGYGPGGGKWGYNGAGGGGYGGVGEYGNPGVAGTSYPSHFMPLAPGSGGAGLTAGSPASLGGNGGGAVRIEASGPVTLDGTVSANGGNGSGIYAGGGSGGGICIQCGDFDGSAAGILRANGGLGLVNANWGGSGGGGRITVWINVAPNIRTRYIDANGNARGVIAATNRPEFRGLTSVEPGAAIHYSPPDYRAAQPGTAFFFKYGKGIMLRIH